MRPTPAQWDLAQGEIHDLRNLKSAVHAGVYNMREGVWTPEQFITWWGQVKEAHERGVLARFKRVTQEYQRLEDS